MLTESEARVAGFMTGIAIVLFVFMLLLLPEFISRKPVIKVCKCMKEKEKIEDKEE